MPLPRLALRLALLSLGGLLLARPAAGELTGARAVAHELNLPAELAHVVGSGSGSLKEACELEPKQFVVEEQFYVVTCMHTAHTVDLVLSGGSLFAGGVAGGGAIPGNIITVHLPQYEEPHVRSVISCRNGTFPSDDCDTYTFDVFRKGGDIATLAMLGVAPQGAQTMFLTPDFNTHTMEYSTEVTLHEPFSITASSAEYKTLVGIEYAGASAALSGLGDQNGCHLGMRKHMRWDLPGFQSIGEHIYTVCAIAPDHHHMLEYKLNVTVVPPYSEELQAITVEPYGLTYKFHPKKNIYEVKIPEERYKKQTNVTISVKANDTEAKIRFSEDGKNIGEVKHGVNKVKVTTKDNDNLKRGETPQWTQAINIEVTSADDRKKKSYLVKVRQQVSTFCKLKDITVGKTNCTLEQVHADEKEKDNATGFDPNHTRYKCVYNYETGKHAEIVAIKDMEKCADCEIRVPDPYANPKRHLSLSYWLMKRVAFDELPVDSHHERVWKRDFLYGEYHTMPIQVVSADKFTDCIYEVYIERWAPWYMRVSTTRFISKSSMTLSWLMSLTGAANVMALAKQVQFMELTTEIDNVPQVYKDYAKTLKAINLDVTQYLPDLGLPTEEDFKRYKERMIEYIKVHTGITNARLLTQYAYAHRTWGRVGANAILHAHPDDTAQLVAHKDSAFECKNQASGLCKKIAQQKKAKEKAEEEAKEAEEAAKEAEEADDKAADVETERRLEASGVNATSRTMLRGTLGNGSFSTLAVRILSEAGMDHVTKFRRLDDDEEEEDDDQKKYPDVWEWSDDKWRKFIKKAKDDGVTETTYPELPCDSPLIAQAVNTLVWVHNLLLFREMLHSTTGSFLIVLFGIIGLGCTYGAYWTFFMRDNQRRPRVLEPGQFWIFVMDYALIGFSKHATDLLFRESLITFFFFQPMRWMTQTFCVMALLFYPIAFTMFVMWSICKLTGSMERDNTLGRLVFNTTREQWMDPACNDIRVTIEPKIPRSIPMLPQLITKHVRSCVPILDQEGEKLKFDQDTVDDQTGKTYGQLQNEKRATRKKDEMEGKTKQQEELKRMDDNIQNELKDLASSHNTKHMAARQIRLQREAEHARKMEEWNRTHEETIKAQHQRMAELSAQDTSNTEPPWFTIVGNKEHETRTTWFKNDEGIDLDKRDPNYVNVNVNEVVATWTPKKGRADTETLDAEEKFAVLQYIELAMREERKLQKYNILSVVVEHGFMKPCEPILVERKVMLDKQTSGSNVGLTFKKEGNSFVVTEVASGSWAETKHIQVGNLITELGDGKNTSNAGSLSEDEINQRLSSSRPLEVTLHQGTPNGKPVERSWLPDREDYLREDLAEYGQHPWLEEYARGSSYIENDRGERLVYEGDKTSIFGLGWTKTGSGRKAGNCIWMSEPDSGWAIWEAQNLADRGAPNSTKRYADKWQRIFFDYPELPWDKDEEGEDKVKICGSERCSFSKQSIPFYNEIRRGIFTHYRDRVPSSVPPRDKIEIRKWLWDKLKTPMELKLKLSYLANSHPKFFKDQTLMEVSKLDFHQVVFNIETAKPNEEWTEEFGKGRAQGDRSKSKSRSRANTLGTGTQSARTNTMLGGTGTQSITPSSEGSLRGARGEAQSNPHELLEFTLMKFEDLYDWDEEPWWTEAEERAQARGQIKVMFDHEIFWKTAGDPTLGRVRKNNGLVPPNGYSSSSMFMEHSGEVFGTKRYNFVKPDNSLTPVSCNLTMGHVLPLMRYTNRFKANVPIDSLDLPHRAAWQIVIGDKKKGEEFNYCVDRSTTLISILCVSAKAGGLETALVFLLMKVITLINQVFTSFKASQHAEEPEPPPPPAEPAPENQPLLETNGAPASRLSVTSDTVQQNAAQAAHKSRMLVKEVIKSSQQVDVGVLVLQAGTLVLLAFGQPKLPEFLKLHENLCAFACIVICSFTMVFMNVFTFSAEFRKLTDEWTGWIKQLDIARRNMTFQAREFLGGENPLGIAFITVEHGATEQIHAATKIAVVIPDLGIHFEGTPDVDENMPLDEQRAMELLKVMSFYTMQRDSSDDQRPKSIRDHARFNADVSETLAVALSTDQMMMYAKIPQIVATIQCVNHTTSNLSKAQYDNYLTLFKPDDWEPEFDHDSAKVDKMLQGWRQQVHTWFKESLGAVESERTCTTRIEEQLYNLLKKECTGALHRDLLCLNITEIFLPMKGVRHTQDLTDKLGYVSVLYENEKITADFPSNRMSAYGKFKRYTPSASALEAPVVETQEELLELEEDENNPDKPPKKPPSKQHSNLALSIALNSDILIELPVGVTKVRLALWVQLLGKNEEELVAYSSEIDIVAMAEGRASREHLEFFMHNKWKHARGRRLAPFGGEDEEDMDKRTRKQTEAREEAAKGGCRRCCDGFTNALKSFFLCRCCRKEPTEEEIMKSKGVVCMQARRANAREMEHDLNVLLALKDVTQGESSLNLSKLERHMDRYVELSEFFGVYLQEVDVTNMQEHLKRMRKVHDELWPVSERRKSQEDKEKGQHYRQSKILEAGIRRQLEAFEEMEKALDYFEQQIEKVEKRIHEQKANQIYPLPTYFITKRRVSGREVWSGNPDRIHEAKERVVSNVLLDALVKYRLTQAQSAKSIVHYTVLSDHLKPGKNWRPDTIVPHVAALVTNDYEDVPQVRLTGGHLREGKADATFERQLKPGTKDEPVVLNGRLVYKAVEGEVFQDQNQDVWLYWDGHCRWVISPFYGVPAPYGLQHEEASAGKFMWNKDPAVTPDKITNTWMIWRKAKRRNSVGSVGKEGSDNAKKWEKDPLMKVLGKSTTTRRRGKNFEGNIQTLDDQQQFDEPEGIGAMVTQMATGMMKDAFSEVLNLFTMSGHQRTDPCLHECLVSLDSKYLSFAWKDFSIERLAPFRKFLLTEFGTYQSAWVFITRKLQMPRSLATKNLANIFKRTMELIDLDDREEKELEAQRMQELADLEAASPHSPASPDEATPKTTTVSFFGFGGKSKAQSKKKTHNGSMPNAASSPDVHAKREDQTVRADPAKRDETLNTHASLGTYGTIHSQCSRFNPETRASLREFLMKKRDFGESDKKKKKGSEKTSIFGSTKSTNNKKVVEAEKYEQMVSFEQLADKIMDILDRPPQNGQVSVEELHSLYEEDATEELLAEFQAFLLAHPMYRDIEYFWEPFSDGLEITLDEFRDATERIMLKFPSVIKHEEHHLDQDPNNPDNEEAMKATQSTDSTVPVEKGMTAAKKAEQLFSELDAQNMSGGISFQEIRPFSGEKFEDADKSMLRFQIPLSHVKEILCQGHIKKFSEDKRCLRFHINSQFENSSAWRHFRTALNPDWEPAPNNESIQVCMAAQFYDLWRQVIKTSEMVTPQEWIRYYDGEYKEHPIITGTYMRHGEGTQRWSNGQVYVGQWQNHEYEGTGRLWASVPDFESARPPIYQGGWYCGKQHGMGTMRYEQDLQDRRGKAALTRGQHAGISKIYRGGFRNGLFHGRGHLCMEKAVAQHLSGRSRSASEQNPGYVPVPILDPASIIDFDGEFESEWEKTNELIRKEDPVYDSRNPRIMFTKKKGAFGRDAEMVEKMDLKLDELTKYDLEDPRFTRFFAVDKSRVQKAGNVLPDLALAAYQQRGGDAMHMAWAISCRFADGTEYVGRFEGGRPHTLPKEEPPEGGDPASPASPATTMENAPPEAAEDPKERYGTATQYEVLPNGEKGPFLAEYAGEFLNGKRHGYGRYETWDGLVYEGEWAENKRNGAGKQTITEKLQATYGYTSYSGEWKDDKKQGDGELCFGDGGLLLYEGQFTDDLREGKGFIYLLGGDKDGEGRSKSKKSTLTQERGDRVVVYNGTFKRDLPFSAHDAPIWSHLVVPGDVRGRFFYGRLDEEGKRTGVGTVYDEDADESQEFLDCFADGARYEKEDVNDTSTWTYITYHGEFKNDLPHGEGMQHFYDRSDKRKSGIYKGQFVDGRRHGRGTWTSKDDSWKYRPIESSHVANWDRDLMHGIAIVEDRDHVHENVVYTHGRCQMPFTDMGPPLTGFDNTVLIGSVVKVGRMAGKAGRYGHHGPGASIASSSKKRYGLFGFGREDHEQGVNAQETKAVQLMSNTVVMSKKKGSNDNGNNRTTAMARTEEEEDMEALAMVREETDLSLPEEDVMIRGGTGENQVLNGLYFKLSGTYGLSVYKLAKQNTAVMKAPNVRYLFRDTKTKCWVIAPKPLTGIIQGAGCAFVEDDEAEKPGAITADWYVWYPPKKSMKSPLDEEDQEVAEKVVGVDRITSVSIVGFEVFGIEKTKIKPGLLLRHGRDLYGRPVYEAESGGQFLYWMRNNGTLAQGMLEDDTELTGGTPDHRKLFAYSGHWIIAQEVGEQKEGPTCLAWVDDIAVTPDQIHPRATWHVAVGTKKQKEVGYIYETSTSMRLHPEEWIKNTSTLANFDEEDPTPRPDAKEGSKAKP